jgi:hypothetical protein
VSLRSSTRIALACALGWASTGCGEYRYETFVAELDGSAEGVTTPAHGRAILLLRRDGESAEISVSVSGLQNPIIGAHIHRAPRGMAGPTVYPLWDPIFGPFDNENPILRTWDRSGAFGSEPLGPEMLAELRAGNLYVNVHTRERPSGEIRGQLLPE